MPPIAIVLHGTTSAGKTSLVKALQASATTPVFHISLDDFVCISNRGDMRSDAEREQAFRLHCQNTQSTLLTVAASYFDIVLESVHRDESEFSACLSALGARPTFIIGVQCPLEVLEERERLREDRAIGKAREQFGHPAFSREYSRVLDTATMNPEDGARIIRELVDA